MAAVDSADPGPLPVLLGSRPRCLEEAEGSAKVARRPTPVDIDIPEDNDATSNALRVKNTFYEGSAQRSPSLEAHYTERGSLSCPGRNVGCLVELLQPDWMPDHLDPAEACLVQPAAAPVASPYSATHGSCLIHTPTASEHGELPFPMAAYQSSVMSGFDMGYTNYAYMDYATSAGLAGLYQTTLYQEAQGRAEEGLQEMSEAAGAPPEKANRKVLNLASALEGPPEFLVASLPLSNVTEKRGTEPPPDLSEHDHYNDFLSTPLPLGGQDPEPVKEPLLTAPPPTQGLESFWRLDLDNGPPPPPSDPAPGSRGMPSLGSASHAAGTCKPCAFLHTKGCENGFACPFCHSCGPEEKKRRRKDKLDVRRASQKARHVARTAALVGSE